MADRISQIVPESLLTGTPKARISQIAPESLLTGTPKARLSQEVIESFLTATPKARVSQVCIEVLVPNTAAPASAIISQVAIETALISHSFARLCQIVIECLVPNIEVTMPPVYPTLPGLGFSVLWEPQFSNMPTAKSASGAELDLALAANPLHMFTLTYNFLRDRLGNLEFKTLMGFFLALNGNVGRFLFKNPDDCSVTQQAIGTTDGVAHTWQLVRTFGDANNSGTEPVGYVDLTQPFNVYFDGILQTPDTYTVAQTAPVNQELVFVGTPAAGHVITVDMTYFYYCKFSTANLSFEKFMHQLWSVKKVEIQSNRAGT